MPSPVSILRTPIPILPEGQSAQLPGLLRSLYQHQHIAIIRAIRRPGLAQRATPVKDLEPRPAILPFLAPPTTLALLPLLATRTWRALFAGWTLGARRAVLGNDLLGVGLG